MSDAELQREITGIRTALQNGVAAAVVGIAVERNRARRRLKAVAEKVVPRCGQPGFDYVAIARQGTLTRPFADLVADFEAALKGVHEKRQKRGAA